MIVDRIENWRRYSNAPAWERAFTFLLAAKPSMPDGNQSVGGPGVEARIASYPTRPRGNALLEAHRTYVDIQMLLEGSERIEWFPVRELKTTTPYDPDKDAEFFDVPAASPATLVLEPGFFVVFFPQDAHLTQVMSGTAPSHVKKVVMKVNANSLSF